MSSRNGGQTTDREEKVTLCHVSPGSPEDARSIVVSEAAVSAHLAHGDSLGECAPTCDAGPPAPLPKTGETTCWGLDGNPIDCAGTGQDGEYQKGVSVDPRFTDNGDGTVKDNLTGLIWLKDAGCFVPQDWTTGLSSANTLASGACGLTDGSVAGDWRLPNIKELESLIDYGQVGLALPPGHPFAFVQVSQPYWSSTNSVQRLGFYACHVDFGEGGVSSHDKTTPNNVWPVRGGQ